MDPKLKTVSWDKATIIQRLRITEILMNNNNNYE